jgi:hypothetical protein
VVPDFLTMYKVTSSSLMKIMMSTSQGEKLKALH